MNSPNPPPKRTSNTCVTCRARKVRCDGNRDVCNNCVRLGFTCSYDDTAIGSGVLETSDPPRRRVRQACLSCHSRKAKCSGTTPKCDRCRAQGLECVYRPSKRSRLSTTPGFGHAHHGDASVLEGGAGHPARDDYLSDHSRSISSDHGERHRGYTPVPVGRDLPAPDEQLILRTFDNFFRHVHHIPMFGFLHRASLMQRYHAGLMDRPLLLSLIGITSLLTDLGPGLHEYGKKCIDVAESLVLSDLQRPTVLKLQAFILIIKHRIFSRRFSAAFMLTALASRFAAALRLNHENPKLCFLAQESRRRLMWALYMLDTAIAGGHADFSLWSDRPDAIEIKLPCNERNFEYDLPELTESLQPPTPLPDGSLAPLPDDIGFLALHIRIVWIRSRILSFTKSMLARPTDPAELSMLPARCQALQAELDAFETRLPMSFRWSESNVRLRTYSPRLCVFVMTHVWWRQCHCDLYRVGLTGMRDSISSNAIDMLDIDFVKHCERQCYQHARGMADMFALLLQLDKGVPLCDLDLPVCVYQCARMLYYSLATNTDDLTITGESVREMAGVCLKVAKQSTPGPAAAAIRDGLEKLMAQGWSRRTTPAPSRAISPAPRTTVALTDDGSVAVDPMLSRDALQDADVPHSLRNPAIPQNQNEPAAPQAMEVEQPPHVLPTTEEPSHPRDAVMSNDTTASNISNAFEGALDGLDFGVDPFGMDTMSWYTGTWLDPEIGRPDGMMPPGMG